MPKLVALILIAAVAGCATKPPPDVRTLPAGMHDETKTIYYEVDALSQSDMRSVGERMANDVNIFNQSQLSVPGEIQNGVGPFETAGITSSRISYMYDTAPRDGACGTTNVRVLVTTIIRLQHWTAPGGMNTQITKAWGNYEGQLTAHEHRHAQYAEDAGNQLQTALVALSAPTCPQLRRLAVEAYNRVRSAESRLNLELDRNEHGTLFWNYAR